MFERRELVYNNGDRDYKAVVVSVEPGVGYTIVRKYDKKRFLLCHDLRGVPEKIGKTMIEYVSGCIERGRLTATGFDACYEEVSGLRSGDEPTADDCVFNK